MTIRDFDTPKKLLRFLLDIFLPAATLAVPVVGLCTTGDGTSDALLIWLLIGIFWPQSRIMNMKARRVCVD